jgi:hypothetical protein
MKIRYVLTSLTVLVVAGLMFLAVPGGFIFTLIVQFGLVVLLVVLSNISGMSRRIRVQKHQSPAVIAVGIPVYFTFTMMVYTLERQIVEIGLSADATGGDGTPGAWLVIMYVLSILLSAVTATFIYIVAVNAKQNLD